MLSLFIFQTGLQYFRDGSRERGGGGLLLGTLVFTLVQLQTFRDARHG